MLYRDFIKNNKTNINNGLDKYRIILKSNGGSTCKLVNARNKIVIMDIAHIVSEVNNGNLALTNPSFLRNWKYLEK